MNANQETAKINRNLAIAALASIPDEKLMELIEAYLPVDYRSSFHGAIARIAARNPFDGLMDVSVTADELGLLLLTLRCELWGDLNDPDMSMPLEEVAAKWHQERAIGPSKSKRVRTHQMEAALIKKLSALLPPLHEVEAA